MELVKRRRAAGRAALAAGLVGALVTVAACTTAERSSAGYRAGGAAERAGAETAAHADGRLTVAQLVEAGSQDAVVMGELGPDAQVFHSDVMTLSNPFFEGRGPGTRGIELAAQYIERRFETLGLGPLPSASGDGSYRHCFQVSGEVEVERASTRTLARTPGAPDGAPVPTTLAPETDFTALGVSASAPASGPVVFVGYSVEDGPGGYTSIPAGVSLEGKVAMVMRFEPKNEEGKSLWSESARWSIRANLAPKIQHAFARGAAAVILVNAPGADDARAERMMTTGESAFGEPQRGPVIMLSNDAADRLVRAGDAQGRSLMDLRRLADRGEGGAIDLPNVVVELDIVVEKEQIGTCNVGGVLTGRGELADEYVVIGAHYDHLGFGNFGSNDPEPRGKIHPGADDNASGTAGVLLAADRLMERYGALPEGVPARSIIFLCFSAEEMGLIGSREFVQGNLVPAGSIHFMINMDMIGRVKDREVQVGGLGTAKEIESIADPILEASGLKVSRVRGGWGPSDHTSFSAASVPVLTFFSGLHSEYHTPRDVGWLVNSAGGAAVALLAADIAYELALRQGTLAFVETRPEGGPGARRSDAKVRLGITPDMGAYAGDEKIGVLVGDVAPEGSAASGGIRKGDRLIRWDGEELADIRAMMQRLATHNPGDKVQITVLREGQEVNLVVTLQERGGGGLREAEDALEHGHEHGAPAKEFAP